MEPISHCWACTQGLPLDSAHPHGIGTIEHPTPNISEDMIRRGYNWEPVGSSPTLKDEVYAMLAELNVPGQLNNETVNILWPHLEDAVKWRKR